jgi:hypothetical protein
MIIYVNAAAGLDGNGSKERPFRRINEAARIAMPGDTMVMGPAGAKFGDFFKSGLVMSAAAFVVSMILLPIFYPF